MALEQKKQPNLDVAASVMVCDGMIAAGKLSSADLVMTISLRPDDRTP